MVVIETEGLSKLYGKARGIEDVTFSVGAGEVFGFLGPNGAGKTTTIRALLDGIDSLAFAGVTVAAVLLAAIGAWLFERRDLAG